MKQHVQRAVPFIHHQANELKTMTRDLQDGTDDAFDCLKSLGTLNSSVATRFATLSKELTELNAKLAQLQSSNKKA
jgi:hypothetical protein